jgi:hypothetical protein
MLSLARKLKRVEEFSFAWDEAVCLANSAPRPFRAIRAIE